MNLKIAALLIIYWSIWILICTVGVSDGSNFLVTGGLTTTASLNSTGFSASELDSGGFFSGVIGVFNAMLRFIGLALFGITPVLAGTWQLIFTAWQSGVTLFTIGFIIDSFWQG